MGTYKVLVCGGREYDNRDKIYHVLDAQLAKIGDSMLLITGGATGADTIAREWAVDRRVDHMILHAKWERFGKAAGPIRNRRMAGKKPRLVLVFHQDLDNSRGTRDMVSVAESKHIKTKRFS
jgi:YspA, cpYpsA-related SLOG family